MICKSVKTIKPPHHHSGLWDNKQTGLWDNKRTNCKEIKLWQFLKSYLSLFLEFIIGSYGDKFIARRFVMASSCFGLSKIRTRGNVHYMEKWSEKWEENPCLYSYPCRLSYLFIRRLTPIQYLYHSINRSQYIAKRKKIPKRTNHMPSLHGKRINIFFIDGKATRYKTKPLGRT